MPHRDFYLARRQKSGLETRRPAISTFRSRLPSAKMVQDSWLPPMAARKGKIVITDPTIDIEQLLAPNSEEAPCGTDPRSGPAWTDMKAARQSRGENDPFSDSDVEPADWPHVAKTAQGILRGEGKHIEVACDLTEALIRLHGYAGLRDGLRLIRELQERHWEHFYPVLDTEDEMALEESLLDRGGPLNGLNTNIVNALGQVQVTGAAGMDNFSWLLYNDAQYVENEGRKDAEARSRLIADGRPDPDLVASAIGATDWQFYEGGLTCLTEASEELRKLDDLLDEKYAQLRDEGPTLQGIKDVLQDCTVFFEATLKEKKPPELAEAADGTEVTAAAGPATAPRAGGDPLHPADRADALRRLRAVADFFKRTEPHSPVSYLVQRAASWGEMSLQEWLQEVVKDTGTLGQIRETLGIKEGENPGEGGNSSW